MLDFAGIIKIFTNSIKVASLALNNEKKNSLSEILP